MGAGLGNTELAVQRKDLLGIFSPGGVEHAEHFVNPVGKVGGHVLGNPFAIDFFQDSKYNMKRVYQDLEMVIRRGGSFGFQRNCPFAGGGFPTDGGAVAVGRTAQQVVAGNLIVVGGPHQKVQAAFSNAFFIVGEQRLGNAQIGRRLLLTKASFFSQEGQDPWEIAVRHKEHLDCRRGPCETSPGKDGLWEVQSA